MTAPRPDLAAVPLTDDEVRRIATRRRRVPSWARRAGARLLGPARLLPGLGAAGCAFAGAWLVWSLGVALLVAAGLLLLVDARTPAR